MVDAKLLPRFLRPRIQWRRLGIADGELLIAGKFGNLNTFIFTHLLILYNK